VVARLRYELALEVFAQLRIVRQRDNRSLEREGPQLLRLLLLRRKRR
jgi:hypothetical protein